MKTKVLVLSAVVTAFAFTSFAAEPLLSPRAKDNQIKVVTSSISTQGGTVEYVTSTSPALLSPRAKANQTKVVKGVSNNVNPAFACQKNMTASPKAIQACIESGTMSGCAPAIKVAPLK